MKLNELSPIMESRGFVARKPGDEYVDPINRDDVAIFQGLTLLPPKGKQIEYPDYDTMIGAVEEWEASATGNVYRLNNPIRSMKAAMIVNMDTERGTEHFILFTKDLGNTEGKLVNIPAGAIPGHGGYVMNRDVSHSERAGLKPAEVITTDKPVNPRSVANLLNAARETAGNEAVDQMQQYIKALLAKKGTDFKIVGGAKNAKLHQKYLGEWASPIALMTGQFEPKSQLAEIQADMIGGNNIADSKILYNNNAREALFDSAVISDPYQILISTKAKTGGAAASLKGLYDTIVDKADAFPASFWRNAKARKFKAIATIIMENPAVEGLLDAAVAEDIISAVDRSRIIAGLESERTAKASFKPTPALLNYMGDYAANTNHPQYSKPKHALASVARELTNKLNGEDYTDVVKQILNRANVVQMYFNAVPKGDDLICKGFTLVWPPRFEGKIKFHSGKAFSATEIKGRLGFKIGSGAAMIDDPDESLKVTIDDRALAKKAKAEKKANELEVGKITSKGERDQRDVSVNDVVALGRSRKK